MSITFLVRHADGTYTRERPEDVRSDDLMVFDGPESTAALDEADAALKAEIQAAGGLEQWRATVGKVKSPR